MTAPVLGTVAYAPLTVKTYLDGVLDANVRVATEVPADRPALLVVIATVPTGDGGNLVLSWRRLTIYCSAADEMTAGQLAETVFAQLKSARYAGAGIRAVTVVGVPARFDDPDDGTPRFQMTVDVLLRATTSNQLRRSF
jgi:hypothetical protein